MILQMDLQEKLRRFKGNRSYADIARAIGCSPENVRRIIDSGTEPKFILGVRLARTLGADVDWLIDETAEGAPPVDDRQRIAAIMEDALNGAGITGELSADEIRLVGDFRQLNRDQRNHLDGFLKGLLAQVSREPPSPEAVGREVAEAIDRVHEARRQGHGRPSGSAGRLPGDNRTA